MTNLDLITLPLLASSSCYFLKFLNPKKFAILSTTFTFISFIASLFITFTSSSPNQNLQSYFVVLTLFISLIISKYSLNYLQGEKNQKKYHLYLGLLTASLVSMLTSVSIFSLSIFALLSNLLFGMLMMHKNNWKAAKEGAFFFIKNCLMSFTCLTIGAILISSQLKTHNIDEIVNNAKEIPQAYLVAFLLLTTVSCLIQSGLWPFHKWVLSSLNSITPVTAFMHAGLITGGGIFILRFYKLFLASPMILEIIFVFGCISLVIGTLLKLSQNSLKKALASSTIAQMGFMFVQIGLGLPFAAFLHIIFHSLFKAFLFINSPSQINEKLTKKTTTQSTYSHLFSFITALISIYVFQLASKVPFNFINTSSLLLVFVFVTSLQISLKIIKTNYLTLSFTLSLILTSVLSFLYGSSLHYLESSFALFQNEQSISITFVHLSMIIIIAIISLFINLKTFETSPILKKIYSRLYVFLINQGLSKSSTTNVVRTEYQN